ncbi:hypothetical protein U1Q18_000193 [Sarracenia purpurea var. burkii]
MLFSAVFSNTSIVVFFLICSAIPTVVSSLSSLPLLHISLSFSGDQRKHQRRAGGEVVTAGSLPNLQRCLLLLLCNSSGGAVPLFSPPVTPFSLLFRRSTQTPEARRW